MIQLIFFINHKYLSVKLNNNKFLLTSTKCGITLSTGIKKQHQSRNENRKDEPTEP